LGGYASIEGIDLTALEIHGLQRAEVLDTQRLHPPERLVWTPTAQSTVVARVVVQNGEARLDAIVADLDGVHRA
jgi:hypothetical protein